MITLSQRFSTLAFAGHMQETIQSILAQNIAKKIINLTSGLCTGALCYISMLKLFQDLPLWALATLQYPTTIATLFSIGNIICTIILFTDAPEHSDEGHWGWHYLALLPTLLVATICAITGYVFAKPFADHTIALLMATCSFACNFRIFINKGAQKLRIFFGYTAPQPHSHSHSVDQRLNPSPKTTDETSNSALSKPLALILSTLQSTAYCALNHSILLEVFAILTLPQPLAAFLAYTLIAGLLLGELQFNYLEAKNFLNHVKLPKLSSTSSTIKGIIKKAPSNLATFINAIANGFIVKSDFVNKEPLTAQLFFFNACTMSFMLMQNSFKSELSPILPTAQDARLKCIIMASCTLLALPLFLFSASIGAATLLGGFFLQHHVVTLLPSHAHGSDQGAGTPPTDPLHSGDLPPKPPLNLGQPDASQSNNMPQPPIPTSHSPIGATS